MNEDQPQLTFCPRSGLPLRIVEPQAPHTHTIILLHGKGEDGIGFSEQLLEHVYDSQGDTLPKTFPTVKWVFPCAPEGIDSRKNIRTTQWFDVWDTTKPWERADLQWPGLIAGERDIRRLINAEATIIPSANILIGGISQGCALALSIFLCSRMKLGGFLGMCGWMPLLNCTIDGAYGSTSRLVTHWKVPVHAKVRDSPLFFTHSKGDDKVPYVNYLEMITTLRQAELEIDAYEHDYEGHWIAEEEAVDVMVEFLITKINIPRPRGVSEW